VIQRFVFVSVGARHADDRRFRSSGSLGASVVGIRPLNPKRSFCAAWRARPNSNDWRPDAAVRGASNGLAVDRHSLWVINSIPRRSRARNRAAALADDGSHFALEPRGGRQRSAGRPADSHRRRRSTLDRVQTPPDRTGSWSVVGFTTPEVGYALWQNEQVTSSVSSTRQSPTLKRVSGRPASLRRLVLACGSSARATSAPVTRWRTCASSRRRSRTQCG
jgi:hypothetical protein